MHFHQKAYVCIHVFNATKPVLLVSRQHGDWSFLCGEEHDDEPASYRVVGASHVLDRDATLQVISDLPSGWDAERASVGAPWLRTPSDASDS